MKEEQEDHKCQCEGKEEYTGWKVVVKVSKKICEMIVDLVVIYCLFTGCTRGCSSSDWRKNKELEIKEKELEIRFKELEKGRYE
jgi:hypothetical protein